MNGHFTYRTSFPGPPFPVPGILHHYWLRLSAVSQLCRLSPCSGPSFLAGLFHASVCRHHQQHTATEIHCSPLCSVTPRGDESVHIQVPDTCLPHSTLAGSAYVLSAPPDGDVEDHIYFCILRSEFCTLRRLNKYMSGVTDLVFLLRLLSRAENSFPGRGFNCLIIRNFPHVFFLFCSISG